MPSLQVKGVPDEVHAVLRRRAALAGQSLQEYMLSVLQEFASTPTLDEVLDRIEHRSGGDVSLETATEMVRADRESR